MTGQITRWSGLALALALAGLLLGWPLVASAQYRLNVREADMRAFIADAAEVTGRTFILDPAVQGRVSVVTERPLSRSEYFELFLSTLRTNGYAGPLGPASAGVMADYVLVDMFAEAATGQRTPEQAAKRAAERAKRYYRT